VPNPHLKEVGGATGDGGEYLGKEAPLSCVCSRVRVSRGWCALVFGARMRG
jgi:hypothetical protein